MKQRGYQFFTTLFLTFGITLFGQIKDFEYNYTPIKSAGELPKAITASATQKAEEDLKKLKTDQDHSNSQAKEKFYIESNFQIDNIIRSGKILFNDSLSNFVNRVADITFANEPELRKRIQIYVLKSDIVNAFTADNGTILVSMGLLAQLDNEAQLAFILCHEVQHFLKKHSIESYLEYNSRKTRYTSKEILDRYKYSQSNELEADVEGVKLFSKTKYSFKGVTGAFNVLKYSYLPFDEVPFEKTFFEDNDLVFNSEYFLKAVNPIKKEDDYDDSKSTHPNIKKRKEAVSNELGEIVEEGRQKFIIGQDLFLKMRETARFELCRIELLNRDYADCIYDCYLLSKKYPNNIYIKTTIGKALFQIAADKSPEVNNYPGSLIPPLDLTIRQPISYNSDDIEGNLQQVYHLFKTLDAKECTILALHYNWKLKKSLNTTSPPIVNQLCDSLFSFLGVHNDMDVSAFSKVTRTEYVESFKPKKVDTTQTITAVDTTKKEVAPPAPKKLTLDALDNVENDDSKTTRIIVQKITSEQKKDSVASPEKKVDLAAVNDSLAKIEINKNYDKYVFATLLKDSVFKRKFMAAEARGDDIDNENKKNKNRHRRSYENIGGLGTDTIIILDPFYFKFDERLQGKVKYFDADKRLDYYSGILQENAQRAGLNYKFIDSRLLTAGDVEKYNDYTLFNDWMTEYLSHDYSKNMMVLNNDAAAVLKQKYNSRYILWTGIVNARMQKENVALALALSIFLYPLPFTIPYLLKKEEHTIYVSVVFDLEENKIVHYNTKSLKMSDTKDLLSAFTYDTMLTLKTKPKLK